MKRVSPLLDELRTWLRGRLSMTGEEKVWLLMILVIIWVGLLGRYLHLKNQTAEPLTPAQVEQLLAP